MIDSFLIANSLLFRSTRVLLRLVDEVLKLDKPFDLETGQPGSYFQWGHLCYSMSPTIGVIPSLRPSGDDLEMVQMALASPHCSLVFDLVDSYLYSNTLLN